MTTREVDEAHLPPELLALRGKVVRMVSHDGTECPATVSGFELIGFDDAPFEESQRWEKVEEPKTPDASYERPRMAALAWRHSRRFLRAELSSACAPGDWAASLPVKIFQRHEVSPALAHAALEAWVRLPDYSEMNRAWRRSPRELPDGTPAEPTYVEHRPPQLTELVLGDRRFLIGRALDELPCWPFQGALWAVWQVEGGASPRLELIHSGRARHRGLEVKSVALIDGEPLLLTEYWGGKSAFFVRSQRLVGDPSLDLSLGTYGYSYVCKPDQY